jgi:hypothetical protein
MKQTWSNSLAGIFCNFNFFSKNSCGVIATLGSSPVSMTPNEAEGYRGLAQHGGQPGWLEESDLAGELLLLLWPLFHRCAVKTSEIFRGKNNSMFSP